MGLFSKDKAPPPPVIAPPQPSAQEIQLQQMQNQAAYDLLSRGEQDYQQANNLFGQVTSGQSELAPYSRNMIDQLVALQRDQAMQAFTTGNNQRVFDTQQRDTLANLLSRGLTNSTTGASALASLGRQQILGLGEINNQAQQLGLQSVYDAYQQQLMRQMNIGNVLYQGSGVNTQAGVNTARNLESAVKANRLDAFNVDVQNQQAKYQYDLAEASRGGLGFGFGAFPYIASNVFANQNLSRSPAPQRQVANPGTQQVPGGGGNSLLQNLLPLIGGAFGSAFGGPVGGALGSGAGRFLGSNFYSTSLPPVNGPAPVPAFPGTENRQGFSPFAGY